MRRPTLLTSVMAVGLAALVTSGCLSSGGSSGGSGSGSGNNSKTVEFMLGFTGDQFDAFKPTVEEYAKTQGITIKWTPTSNFNQLINTRVQANDLPDLAMFPQPGILTGFAAKGKMAPLSDFVDMSDLQANYTPGSLDYGTVNGKLYGALVSMNVKSLVYYPKKAFEKAGYKVPKTQAELMALTNKIKGDGTTPWCMGIESASATGWPATDWIEDLTLQQQGIDKYNSWVKHDIKFDSPEIKQAADTFASYAFTSGNVLGGRKSIASNNFLTAANTMFNPKPGCFLFKQGNFVAAKGGFPDKVLKNIDSTVGVFAFPPVTAGGGGTLGGGDMIGLFNKDSDASKTIIKYMTSKEFGASAAKAGNFISPRKDFDQSNYPSQTIKKIADVAYNAKVFAFDGSDQMPGAVGSGSFWKDMTAWISGSLTEEKALKDIDSTWPAS